MKKFILHWKINAGRSKANKSKSVWMQVVVHVKRIKESSDAHFINVYLLFLKCLMKQKKKTQQHYKHARVPADNSIKDLL